MSHKYSYIILSLFLLTSNVIAQTKQAERYQIARGDQLTVEVMDHHEFDRSNILVLPDGYIQYPALGSMKVVGMTAKSLSDTIQSRLNYKYVVNPIVTVYIHRLEKQNINIFGKVKTPGVYRIYEPTELLEAIGLAGGVIKIKNSTELVIVSEDGRAKTIKLKKYIKDMRRKKVFVNAGDSIYIKHFEINWSFLAFITSLAGLLVTLNHYQ